MLVVKVLRDSIQKEVFKVLNWTKKNQFQISYLYLITSNLFYFYNFNLNINTIFIIFL